MIDYRSPLGDKKLTFIGIFLTVMVAVIFIIPCFYNIRYSDVEAEKAGTPNDVTKVTVNLIPAETMMGAPKEEIKVHYIPSSVVEQQAEVEYQEWLESEAYLPDSVKIQKHEIEATEAEKREEESTNVATDNGYSYYGPFQLTAYTWTGNPCADGVYPSSGYTVACNDRSLWHKWIYIEGYGTYYVHDTGGMGGGVIDIYMDSYDACIQFGRRSANIYIVN